MVNVFDSGSSGLGLRAGRGQIVLCSWVRSFTPTDLRNRSGQPALD